jgi:drug/metabolite transporter (DMT)-like permease
MNALLSPLASRARTWLFAAFAIVYLVWGSTYLAIRVAVGTLPPFLLAGARFLFAGLVLLVWLRWRGVTLPTRNQWHHAAIVGVLLLVGGNGLVVWAEQSVSSSMAALLVALTPVWFALLEWLRPGGARPTLQTVIGIVVGFSGVALLVSGKNTIIPGGPVNYRGLLALVLAGGCWAAGSLWSRYHPHTDSPWMTAAAQMISGGAALLVVAFLLGEPAQFHASQVSRASWLALSYLVVFGSWIAFSAYIYLLRASTPSRVATYAYVNPVIAVLLGWLVLGEPLSRQTLWAAAIILAGVIITTLPRRV